MHDWKFLKKLTRVWPEIVLNKRLKTGLQSPQSSLCLLLDYLQTLKYEDSSLIEPDFFAFGPGEGYFGVKRIGMTAGNPRKLP